MLTDFVAWTYIIGLILFSYGMFLFIFEIIRRKGGSWIFYYITLLFIGTVMAGCVDVYARYLRIDSIGCYYKFTDSLLWDVRRLPILLSILFIDVHATARIAKRMRDEHDPVQIDKDEI